MIETTSSSKELELLDSLGLTPNAAKIFIALSNLEASKALTISKTSGVAREIVYQTMPRLVKEGLVEEVLTSPKLFKAIPLKEAYNLLLHRKKLENEKITQEIEEVLKKKSAHNFQAEHHYHTSIVSSGGHKQHFKIKREIDKVQKNMDMTFPLGKFLQWTQHYAELDIEELMEKKVNMRIVVDKQLLDILKNSPELFSPKTISNLKYINFRYIQNSPPVEIIIFDKETMFLSTKKEPNINRMQWLYSNNIFLLEIANNYYETLWENAAELCT
ncbi:MAG: TrmB family transcriptional regulator [Promethearchaeota archaeon]